MSTVESHCARCLKPAPPEDDDEFTDWEALPAPDMDETGEVIVLCPDCITPEEQQAMDEADMETGDEAYVLEVLDEIADVDWPDQKGK